MKRLAFGVLCMGLAVVVSGGCGGGSGEAGALTMGNFNPFGGGDADFGPEMMGGCVPAVRLINAAGGVLGHTVKCVAVDTRGDPADAVPAATKMLATTSNLVGVLG